MDCFSSFFLRFSSERCLQNDEKDQQHCVDQIIPLFKRSLFILVQLAAIPGCSKFLIQILNHPWAGNVGDGALTAVAG